MSTQDVLVGQRKSRLPVDTHRIRKRPPIVVSLTLMLFLGMMLFVFGVVLPARVIPARQLIDLDLPQAYLPGNLMPEDVSCYTIAYESPGGCSVNYRHNEVLLKLDAYRNMILRATIQTHEYRIGELILAWGTPTGIVQTYYLTLVQWGARSAYIYSDSFQPDSRVEFVMYDLAEPQRASRWRGFRQYRN